MSSKNPETSLRRSESHLFTSTAKETNRNLHAQAIDEGEEDAHFEAGEFATPIELHFKELHCCFRTREYQSSVIVFYPSSFSVQVQS